MSCSKHPAIYLSAVAALLVGCGDDTIIDDSCFVDLAPVTARASIISVGDTVTFDADLGPAQCLPAGITTEDWRWSSTDTLIVRIDSLTGLATGVAPGEVAIQVRHALDASVASGASLKVIP